MSGFWAGSDFAGAIVTAIGFLGAIIAFVLTQKLNRNQKVDDERRRPVVDLILAVDGMMARLKQSSLVGVQIVPKIDEEKIAGQKALSVVRAYGCISLVDAAIDYERTIGFYKRALIREKEQRSEQDQDSSLLKNKYARGPKYIEAQAKTKIKFREMQCARDDFLEEVSNTLGVNISKLELSLGNEETEPA